MQAEIQTKVKISVSEIKKILAEKFCLYHDFELELVGDSVVESESVEQDNEGWIDVPKDWKRYRCPTDYPSGTILSCYSGMEEKMRLSITHILSSGAKKEQIWTL